LIQNSILNGFWILFFKQRMAFASVLEKTLLHQLKKTAIESMTVFFFSTLAVGAGGKFPDLSAQPFIRATGDRKRMPLACG
jgi:hypothetical protein